MQNDGENTPTPTDLADLDQFGPEWAAWVEANPDLAAEVVVARRVRRVLEELRSADLVGPANFEARVLARCQRDASILALFDLGFFKGAQALMDLLAAIFALAPQPKGAGA